MVGDIKVEADELEDEAEINPPPLKKDQFTVAVKDVSVDGDDRDVDDGDANGDEHDRNIKD